MLSRRVLFMAIVECPSRLDWVTPLTHNPDLPERYLAVDFQAFLLLPLFSLAYVWHRRAGYVITAMAALASIIYSFALSFKVRPGESELHNRR
jgi:hypothetical protein